MAKTSNTFTSADVALEAMIARYSTEQLEAIAAANQLFVSASWNYASHRNALQIAVREAMQQGIIS